MWPSLLRSIPDWTRASPTRLHLNAFVDLRGFKDKAPEILTRLLEESCNRQIYLEIREVTAKEHTIEVQDSARAQFSRCKRSGGKGIQYFGATVDAVAVGKAELGGQCLNFSIESVDLDPRGFIGAVTELFGLIRCINEAVIEKGGEFLAAHPVCPLLPEEFGVLDPSYDSGSKRGEVPGGMGTAIAGSVDVSAATTIALLSEFKARGLLEFSE